MSVSAPSTPAATTGTGSTPATGLPVEAPGGARAPVARPASRETIRHPGADALDLATVLRTAGDPLRLAMVRALADGEEHLCGALAERLGLPRSTSSYHLRLLREAGLTRTRQDGTLRFISLRRTDLEARFPGLVDVLAANDAD